MKQLGSNTRDNTNSQRPAGIKSASAYDWWGFEAVALVTTMLAATPTAATATVEMAGNVRSHFFRNGRLERLH